MSQKPLCSALVALTIVLTTFSAVAAQTARRVGVTALYLQPNPAEPVYGAVISVQAFIEVDSVQGTSAELITIWTNDISGEQISGEQMAINPKDLVINTALTKATLRLPDGTVLQWVAIPGEYSTDDSSFVNHHGPTTLRYTLANEHHRSNVTGSLDEYAIDSRGSGGVSPYYPREVYIWRQLERTVTSPTPAPSSVITPAATGSFVTR